MISQKPNLLQVAIGNAVILSVLLTLFVSVISPTITALAQIFTFPLKTHKYAG